MEALAAEVEASGSTCDDFETILQAWIGRERASIAHLIEELDQAVTQMSEDEIGVLDGRLTTAFEVIVHRASACADHEGAQRALAEFDALIEG
jgi:hypothetical protein